MDLSEAGQYYAKIGFAARVGSGRQPALLIIDCHHGCADAAVSRIGIAMEEVRAALERCSGGGAPSLLAAKTRMTAGRGGCPLP